MKAKCAGRIRIALSRRVVLSQILRCIGAYLNQKRARLLKIAREGEDVLLEYETSLGSQLKESFALSDLYDMWGEDVFTARRARQSVAISINYYSRGERVFEELRCAGVLRPIGQALEDWGIESFSVWPDGSGFMVRDRTHNRAQIQAREKEYRAIGCPLLALLMPIKMAFVWPRGSSRGVLTEVRLKTLNRQDASDDATPIRPPIRTLRLKFCAQRETSLTSG
jgi:hypothetical protein